MRYLFPTGKGYQRKWLGQDVLSGVVIAAVSIPISMGYAQIAGLPAVYGLYGSLLPVILFALLSTSPQFIFGVDAAPAAMIGGVLGGMGIAMGSAEAERVVPVLTFCVGIWLLLFALLRERECLANRILLELNADFGRLEQSILGMAEPGRAGIRSWSGSRRAHGGRASGSP